VTFISKVNYKSVTEGN